MAADYQPPPPPPPPPPPENPPPLLPDEDEDTGCAAIMAEDMDEVMLDMLCDRLRPEKLDP